MKSKLHVCLIIEASDPTRTPDQGTTLPQNTTEEDSNQPTTSEPTTSSVTETTTNILPTEEPELRTVSTQDSKTVLETSQVTTSPTAASETTTSDVSTDPNKENLTTSPTSFLADVEDPSTSASPTVAGVPTSTVLEQDQTTDAVESESTTADPPKVTSEPTSKPQDQPDSSKLTPTSKPELKPVDPQTQNTDNPGDYQGGKTYDFKIIKEFQKHIVLKIIIKKYPFSSCFAFL